jgi:hypothetical protein
MSIMNQQNLTQEYAAPADAIGPLPDANGPLAVGQAFLSALARRDFAELALCFATEARFRALVPSGVREGTGPQETIAWLRRWFESADLFQLERTALDVVVDRLHISYRIRVRKEGVLYLIEQQAYCEAANGQLNAMNLVCSGFRPL